METHFKQNWMSEIIPVSAGRLVSQTLQANLVKATLCRRSLSCLSFTDSSTAFSRLLVAF